MENTKTICALVLYTAVACGTTEEVSQNNSITTGGSDAVTSSSIGGKGSYDAGGFGGSQNVGGIAGNSGEYSAGGLGGAAAGGNYQGGFGGVGGMGGSAGQGGKCHWNDDDCGCDDDN